MSDNEMKLVDLALDVCPVGNIPNIDISKLRKAPIRRAYLARQLKAELRTEGIEFSERGPVNWEAVKAFLVKYGPILLQLILLLI